MLGINMTLKGQVTVPKDVREALGIQAGDKVYFVADGDRAIMLPLKGDFWGLRGAIKKYAKGHRFDWKTIRRQVKQSRSHRQTGIPGS